jgi:putative membrane protein
MLRLLLRWLLNALALLIVTRLVPGFHIRDLKTALIAALVIGLLNATLGLLLKVITFPLSVITLGLFFLVINAFILKLTSGVVPGYSVTSFAAALIAAVFLALLSILFDSLLD